MIPFLYIAGYALSYALGACVVFALLMAIYPPLAGVFTGLLVWHAFLRH